MHISELFNTLPNACTGNCKIHTVKQLSSLFAVINCLYYWSDGAESAMDAFLNLPPMARHPGKQDPGKAKR